MSTVPTTYVNVFRDRVHASGPKTAIKTKHCGQWEDMTWDQWSTLSRSLAAGLIELGLANGDKVNIQSNTRYEWVIADIGILLGGGVTVPIYQSNRADQCQFIIDDCDARFIFVEDPSQIAKLIEVRETVPKVEKVIYFSDSCELPEADSKGRKSLTLGDVLPEDATDWVMSYEELLTIGANAISNGAGDEVDRRSDAVTPDDVCTIVYTSGTTGNPKGVVLTHGNFAFECNAVLILGITPNDSQLLFLPLAHIFAKVMVAAFIQSGAITAFAEGLLQAVGNMGEIQPTIVASVPRVYEKVYTKVLAGAAQAGGVKKKIVDWAITVGEEICKVHTAGKKPSIGLRFRHNLAMKLVGAKVHQIFGGKIQHFISGGAPLSADISRFFFGFGLEILEGYGLTETTAATHVNRPGNLKFGTVGQALDGVTVLIADDGEILVRGPNVMKGYYKLPEKSQEVMSDDGWFHTGDIGEIDDQGFLRITDRKKDIIVTAGGKNIAPQNIENTLKTDAYISQVMVHGDKRKFLSALVTLDPEAITHWAKENGIEFSDYADLMTKPEVYELVDGIIKDTNAKLPSYETIKKFAILDQDFSQETGELTPTLKVKRKVVTEKHQAVLDSFYTEQY